MPPRTGYCKQGHAVVGENRFVTRRGTYVCRICRREYNRRRWREGIVQGDPEARRRWREKNPEVIRNLHVRRYGISLDDYNRLFSQQGGLCAICQQPERHMNKDGKPHSLCVDHDHGTGTVRGLLCRACNSALGLINDLPERAEAMAVYLRRPGGYRGPRPEDVEYAVKHEPMERR